MAILESDESRYTVNPRIVLREEFDDHAFLYDPDTGATFGLNPMGVLIWKRLDGCRSVKQIIQDLHKICVNVPEDAESHIRAFIEALVGKKFVGKYTY